MRACGCGQERLRGEVLDDGGGAGELTCRRGGRGGQSPRPPVPCEPAAFLFVLNPGLRTDACASGLGAGICWTLRGRRRKALWASITVADGTCWEIAGRRVVAENSSSKLVAADSGVSADRAQNPNSGTKKRNATLGVRTLMTALETQPAASVVRETIRTSGLFSSSKR